MSRARLRKAWPARLASWLILLAAVLVAAPALAHPAPFSYLDVNLHDGIAEGTLTMHVADPAHELGISPTDRLYDPAVLQARFREITEHLDRGLFLRSGGRPLTLKWTGATPIPDQQQLRFSWRAADVTAGSLGARTDLFPYDPNHQTFVNLYQDGTLRQQWIFSHAAPERTYYFGSTAGAVEVIKTFVPAGIHHILIGPDHILFLCGLLLLGGRWQTLVKIVTAFTLGHSLTLSLAALNIFAPPASITEPAIALTIVVVGADNLMRGGGRDLRAFAAALFGLVHGFGFASVLKEFGLPREALAWSLFSFNVGVEIGQLIIVCILATTLEFVRRQNPMIGRRVAVAGSYVVIAAGAFWFVQRVFFPGGNA
ncbi:MAG TPA: HupE/UreJ family protein [Caulobacteraceae bacterium]